MLSGSSELLSAGAARTALILYMCANCTCRACQRTASIIAKLHLKRRLLLLRVFEGHIEQ